MTRKIVIKVIFSYPLSAPCTNSNPLNFLQHVAGQTSVCPRIWTGNSHEEDYNWNIPSIHVLLCVPTLKFYHKILVCTARWPHFLPRIHMHCDRKVAASVYVVDRSLYRLVRHKSGHKCFVQAISRLLPCCQYSAARSSGLTRPMLVSHCIWVNKFKLISSNGHSVGTEYSTESEKTDISP